MKYKLIKRVNPQDRNQSKWYATPVSDGLISKPELTKEIAALSSLSRGDVSNVIESAADITPKYLKLNRSVSLGDLGTLRLSFSSEGVENKEDFRTSMISGVKIIFTPSVQLKLSLNDIHFEIVDDE